MNALFVVLLHGDEMDIIYFWSSIFMILLPITIFSVLTYLILKGYKNREKGEGRGT
jgi:hypothetical protein